MTKTIKGKTHVRGRGRIYFGLGLTGLALFWLVKQAGWLGVDSSGLIWPSLALGLGLIIVLGGRRHTQGFRHHEAADLKGGQS